MEIIRFSHPTVKHFPPGFTAILKIAVLGKMRLPVSPSALPPIFQRERWPPVSAGTTSASSPPVNATLVTARVQGWTGCKKVARRCIPDPHHPIETSGNQLAPVFAECDRVDILLVSAKFTHEFPIVVIHKLDRAAAPAQASHGREGLRRDCDERTAPARFAICHCDSVAVLHPHPHETIAARRCHLCSVRCESDGPYRTVMRFEAAGTLAGTGIEDLDFSNFSLTPRDSDAGRRGIENSTARGLGSHGNASPKYFRLETSIPPDFCQQGKLTWSLLARGGLDLP